MYLMLADSSINPEREFDATITGEILSIHIQNFQCRIKVEYSESLNDMLKNIGIKTAFNTKATQFEKMFNSGNM